MTVILPGHEDSSVSRAIQILKSGGVVAIPTETVYGLAADFSNEAALKKIFEVKGRPLADPLILHLLGLEDLEQCCENIPEPAIDLIKRFWPGPLTLVLKKKESVSRLVTASLETVAVRSPAHPVARKLLSESKLILAAPSANKFQSISPTSAEAVLSELNGAIELILDGGECKVGIESTILDFSHCEQDSSVSVLRLGGQSIDDISEWPELRGLTIYQSEVLQKQEQMNSMVAPGMLEFHYAPKNKLKLFNIENLRMQNQIPIDATWLCFSGEERNFLKGRGVQDIFVLSEAGDILQAGRNYFKVLREIDKSNPGLICAIALPNRALGQAINDRLRKAQH